MNVALKKNVLEPIWKSFYRIDGVSGASVLFLSPLFRCGDVSPRTTGVTVIHWADKNVPPCTRSSSLSGSPSSGPLLRYNSISVLWPFQQSSRSRFTEIWARTT